MLSAWVFQADLLPAWEIPGLWAAPRLQAGHHRWGSHWPQDAQLERLQRKGSPLQPRVDLALPRLGEAKLLSRATHSGFGTRLEQLPRPQRRALLLTLGTFS